MRPPMDSGVVKQLLGTVPDGVPVVATTPHGTYTFDIVEIWTGPDKVTLHLLEQRPEGGAAV